MFVLLGAVKPLFWDGRNGVAMGWNGRSGY